MAAIDPPSLDSLDDTTRDLVELTGIRNNGTPLAIIELLAYRPGLVGPFLQWSAALAGADALGVRRHEIAALRASWHYGSDYEWGNHARYALDAGLTDAELGALGRVEGGALFDETDAAIIELVDSMCASSGSDRSARDRVAALLGTPALVDVVWTVGQYVGLSLVAETLEVPVDPELRRAPPKDTR